MSHTLPLCVVVIVVTVSRSDGDERLSLPFVNTRPEPKRIDEFWSSRIPLIVVLFFTTKVPFKFPRRGNFGVRFLHSEVTDVCVSIDLT